METITNYIKDPLITGNCTEETLQAFVKSSRDPSSALITVNMAVDIVIKDVEKQLPFFIRDWLLHLCNWTQDDMQEFYGSSASKGYIKEKWQKYNQNLVGWVLDLDRAHMSKLARFFNER